MTTELDVFDPPAEEPAVPGARIRTARDVMRLLRERYPDTGYALLEQVRNATGYNRQERYADAVAMSLWPSRGLQIMGFEVKVSRSDWLRELKEPAKVETGIYQFCDHWWVVVSDAGLVKDGELPPTWGLLAPDKSGAKLRIVRQAPLLEPKPLTREFVASVLRNGMKSLTGADVLAAERQAGVDEGIALARRDAELNEGTSANKYAELKRAVEAFEAASGVRISYYDGGHVGEKFRRLEHLDGAEARARNLLAQLGRGANNIQDEVKRIQDALERKP